ncbi:hypothetical protein [Actinomadura parmotrematis]|uniref:Excreted virulence factor EspC (Type VII ESX diderm) n=1 Tax=Actinomadura parmotrematis TaxID=2864039 RepID=A0ABS7FZA1_9ACTN|nr:hypothetical protein [Actinomadura parmotrematis]MBW8484902.1 hypothetical protein [Actinomadura parmotrematis]
MRSASKKTSQVSEGIVSGARPVPGENQQAVAALRGWTMAAALEETVSGWRTALGKLAEQVERAGEAVETCAANHGNADEATRRRLGRIQAGA